MNRFLVAAGAAIAIAMISSPATAQQLTLERVFQSPALSGAQPRGAALSPDGKLATVLLPRAGDRNRFDLLAVDAATGASRMLVDS